MCSTGDLEQPPNVMKNIDRSLLQSSIQDLQRSGDFCEDLVVPIRYERTFVPAFCAKADYLVPPCKTMATG